MTPPSPTAQPLGRYQACGKLILLGEHFVVHGAPALALPCTAAHTEVGVFAAPDADRDQLITSATGAAAAQAEELFALALKRLPQPAGRPAWRVEARSTIPVGEGLGSSAAYAVALVGALARAAGVHLSLDALRAHAHELERRVHGEPSGIDDTTVAFARPVWFMRGAPPQLLEEPGALCLVLASSGRPRSTKLAVSQVRALKERDPGRFLALQDEATHVAEAGRAALQAGDVERLGPLLTRNHELLQALDVSCPELDALVTAALSSGAAGAKLTGAGLGGFVVALAHPERAAAVAEALRRAGAPLVLSGGVP